MTPDAAITAWLVVSITALAVAAYEIAAERGFLKLHTISWLANKHKWLGWLITLGMLGVAGWWIFHFNHPHPR